MISGTKYLLIPISYDRNIIAQKRKFVNKTEKNQQFCKYSLYEKNRQRTIEGKKRSREKSQLK
jgi:hypothetical protein